MFGTYRYFLATLVTVQHVTNLLPWGGIYAVFAFYVLSGYLMALVLAERYDPSPRGVARFLANRVLRVHPPYLAVLAFATLVFFLAPTGWTHLAARFRPSPATPFELVPNLTIVGLSQDRARWIPQAWSLHVELIWYAIMALPILRRPAAVWAWVFAAGAWVIYVLLSPAPTLSTWPQRYFTVPAAALPFGLGALLHQYRGALRAPSRTVLVILVAAFTANVLFAYRIFGWSDLSRGGFYLSLALALALTASLAAVDRRGVPQFWLHVDHWLGAFAYPLFLGHLHVAALVWSLFPPLRTRTVPFLAVSLLTATALAWCVHLAVERPLERWRTAVRGTPR